MSDLALLSRELKNTLPAVGMTEFPSLLVALLRRFVVLDEVSIIVYPDTAAPYIEFREKLAVYDRSKPGLDTFVLGPFLLDPYYIAAAKRSSFGFFPLRELVPKGFRNSEYYQTYYRHAGISDECGYLLPLTTGGFVNISLGMTGVGKKFTATNLARLKDLQGTVCSLGELHWSQTNDGAEHSEELNLRQQLEGALENFGCTVLTKRERQIVFLILHGHTSRSIAERFEISGETVKLHRKNVYAKLGINNQSELFYTFIDSLMSLGQYVGGDPLATYLARLSGRERDAD